MELLEQSAVASLSVRAIGPRTDLGEGYVTLGAGNRARVDRNRAGDAVDADEQIGPNTGAASTGPLTGRRPRRRRRPVLGHRGRPWPTPTACCTARCPAPWARPSSDAGRSAAVIANADGGPPTGVDELPPRGRAGDDGRGGAGRPAAPSRSQLTVVDPAAPGGRRMDPGGRARRLRRRLAARTRSDAVLVEMSDLERADRNGLPADRTRACRWASPTPLAAGRRAARASCSQRVDLSRDRVHRRQPGRARRLRPADGVRPGRARASSPAWPAARRPAATASSRFPTSARPCSTRSASHLPDSMNSTADHLQLAVRRFASPTPAA